jgi:hypothetical protein
MVKFLLGEAAARLPDLPGRMHIMVDEPLPAAELDAIEDPSELALLAGISRQAAHQRLRRQEKTP